MYRVLLRPFDISAADVLLLRESLADLPPERRRVIDAQAVAAASRQQSIEPAWTAPHAVASLGEARFDALCEAVPEPCPGLVDGACAVYEGRPLVCRLMGSVSRRPTGACSRTAARSSPSFPSYAALAPQPFDLGLFEETEQACLEEAGLLLLGAEATPGFETTIAMALAEPGVLP